MQNKPINSAISPILPLKNAITEICGPNLIGYWPVLDRGTLVRDFSGRSNHLTRSGSTYATGPKGNVLNFDGVDDYCTQQIFATKVGTVYLSTAANTAFMIDTDQDFRPYIRAGNSDYMIVVTDSAGLKAWGYVGANGTDETLGSNLITNAGFETYVGSQDDGVSDTFTAWSRGGLNDGAGNRVEATATVQEENNAIKITKMTESPYIYQNMSVIPGKLYKIVVQTRGNGVVCGILQIKDITNDIVILTASTEIIQETYTAYTTYIVAPAGCVSMRIYFKGSNTAGIVYFDAGSLQQALTPPATTGCTIYSTPSGTTQSWANIETGFNPNSIASYEVRRADFQITAALTVGMWVKGAAQTDMVIIAKYETSSLQRQWRLGSGLASNSKLRGVISQDGGNVNIKDYESSKIMFNDSWHLGIITWDGTNLKMYIDGILDTNPTKVSDVATSIFSGMAAVRLGSTTGTDNFLIGNEGHPFICNRALSASEVVAIYNDPQCRP